jgi:hypothetical protein
MNTLFTVVKGCFMGFAFIMFLPTVGFVLTGYAIGKAIWTRLSLGTSRQ